MSGGGPPYQPGYGPPTAPPMPSFGQPGNESGVPLDSSVPSYQCNYPGIYYGQQSDSIYKIPGGGSSIQPSFSDGATGYQGSNRAGAPPAYSLDGSSSFPYPSQGVANVPYPGQGAANPPYPGQGVANQPYSGQGVANQPYPGQGVANQPYPGQGVANQPYPGHGVANQPFPGQGVANPPYSSQGVAIQPYPGQGVANLPYPTQGVANPPYPQNPLLGSHSYEGGNPNQYGNPQMELQGSYSYPSARPYPPPQMSPYPVPQGTHEKGPSYPSTQYMPFQGTVHTSQADAGRAPQPMPQANLQSAPQGQSGSQAYPMVGVVPPTYPSIGGNAPQPLPQKSVPSASPYNQGSPAESFSPRTSKVTKKALVIGCNYQRTSAELKGCINDAKCMQYLLSSKFGFKEQNIRLMTDDQAGRLRPTKQNILEGMRWLVDGSQPGTSLFFHFSGHGSQKRDYSGDEKDGFNETILPTDHKSAGQIVDDDINRFLVNVLTPGVVLHAVIDACHSGTAMDLQFYTKFRSGNWVWKDNGPTQKFKGTRGGIAFQFGACKDSEVAQDTNDLSGNVHTGAATFCFIDAIENGGANQSYGDILSHMHRSLMSLNSGGTSFSGGVSGAVLGMLMNGAARVMGIGKQTPQLSCSEKYDMTKPLRI